MYFLRVLTILLHTLQLLTCHVQRPLAMRYTPSSAWLWPRTLPTSPLPHLHFHDLCAGLHPFYILSPFFGLGAYTCPPEESSFTSFLFGLFFSGLLGAGDQFCTSWVTERWGGTQMWSFTQQLGACLEPDTQSTWLNE